MISCGLGGGPLLHVAMKSKTQRYSTSLVGSFLISFLLERLFLSLPFFDGDFGVLGEMRGMDGRDARVEFGVLGDAGGRGDLALADVSRRGDLPVGETTLPGDLGDLGDGGASVAEFKFDLIALRFFCRFAMSSSTCFMMAR